MTYSDNPAFIALPIGCVLSALATCCACIRLAVQKKYVRHTAPFVCMAGAKNECLLIFRLGGILSCCLYTSSVWLWFMAYKELREAKDDDFSLTPTNWVGPIMATTASLGFIIMCWFNMYDYSNVHDAAGTVGFTCMSTWGGFLLGGTRDINNDRVFAARLSLYLGSQLSLLVFQGFVHKAARMKKSFREKADLDGEAGVSIDVTNTAASRNEKSCEASDSASRNCISSNVREDNHYMAPKPWDKHVKIAAHCEWTALMFFGCLILTLSVDFMHNT